MRSLDDDELAEVTGGARLIWHALGGDEFARDVADGYRFMTKEGVHPVPAAALSFGITAFEATGIPDLKAALDTIPRPPREGYPLGGKRRRPG